MNSHGSLAHRTERGRRPAGRHRREPSPVTAGGRPTRKILPALVLAGLGAATAAASAHGIAVPAHVGAHQLADSVSVAISNRPWIY